MQLLDKLTTLGREGLGFFQRLGKMGIFIYRVICKYPDLKHNFRLFIKQLYAIGVLSLPIILVAGIFIGMVLGLQGYNILRKFGADLALGQLIALSLVRELGPVISGLLFAGRAGSALTAEIGLMKATEQLSSMEMMAVNPISRVIGPRFWGGVVAMPLLALIFSAIAILGGYMVGVELLGVDSGAFWSNMESAVDFHDDVLNGIIKTIVFGSVVTWISLWQGYACKPTSEGIGRGTTRTVVYSSLSILGLDFFLTAVMFGGS